MESKRNTLLFLKIQPNTLLAKLLHSGMLLEVNTYMWASYKC